MWLVSATSFHSVKQNVTNKQTKKTVPLKNEHIWDLLKHNYRFTIPSKFLHSLRKKMCSNSSQGNHVHLYHCPEALPLYLKLTTLLSFPVFHHHHLSLSVILKKI